jgi:hypothetical protein
MSETEMSVAAHSHCRRLRCKEMFIETGQPFDIHNTGSGIYWCLYTQNCLGPDGQVVGPQECTFGRGCHESM